MRIIRAGRARPRSLAIAVGAALVASLVGLPTAAQAQAGTTTVRGTVTVSGRPVAGVTVGTWNPTDRTLATAKTDAHGRFALRTPTGVAVDAFAGSVPSSAHAVFVAGGDHLVRGVIGATAPKNTPAALAQQVTSAVPARLAGGHALRFELQRAGRFTASSPALGAFTDVTGEIDVEHGDGVYGPEYSATAAGVVTSGWLVPARYHLAWNPKPPSTLVRTWVTVRAGTTVTAATPVFATRAVGTTVVIHGTSGGAPLPAGVPVVLRSSDGLSPAPSTDDTGTITEQVSTPGTYRFTVGEYFDDPDEGLEGPPTSDDYLTKTVVVRVAAGQTTATAAVDLLPASKLTGRITAPKASSVLVYAENADHDVVRIGGRQDGTFTLGGLPAGDYTVFAIDLDRHRYDAESVTVPSASSTAAAPTVLARPLVLATVQPTVSGTVTRATDGSITLRSKGVFGVSLYSAYSRISASGHYSVRVIPTRVHAVVTVDHRATKSYASTAYTKSVTQNFIPGARLAGVTARFVVGGYPIVVDAEARRGAALLELQHTARLGRSAAQDAAAGTYTWVRTVGPLPAVDGPWYYSAPRGSFTLHSGATKDLGTVRLAIRG